MINSNIISKLIKDKSKLIEYLRKNITQLKDIIYIAEHHRNSEHTLRCESSDEGVELRINDNLTLNFWGSNSLIKKLTYASILKYIGTEGVRKIVILLIRKEGKVYRCTDLPRLKDAKIQIPIVVVNFFSIAFLSVIIFLPICSINIFPALLTIITLPIIIPLTYLSVIARKFFKFDISDAMIEKVVINLRDDVNTIIINRLVKLLRSAKLKVLFRIVNNLSRSRKYVESIQTEQINIKNLLSKLSSKNLSKTRVYLVDSDKCNASSIKLPTRDIILLTTKLVAQLGSDELLAVLAHECSHLKNNDSLKLLALISLDQFLKILILVLCIFYLHVSVPTIVIILILYSISYYALLAKVLRRYEYVADKYALKITNFVSITKALLKIGWRIATKELLLRSWLDTFQKIFSTHPDILSRVYSLYCECREY
ncbi:MAG: hypothetical protein B6V02_00725 [Thermoprotei archaeon ex4572_64]|nr:MAG: hypothetical protein B6V02_00725 [Thermoprotei archaeon ex4572_64]